MSFFENINLHKNARLCLLVVVIFLVSIGLTMIYSATSHSDGFTYLIKQSVWVLVGGMAATAISFVDYRKYAKYANLMLYFGIVALLYLVIAYFVYKITKGVQLPATKYVNGACRWYEFGPVRLQASEFAKIVVIYFLASYFNRHGNHLYKFVKGVAIPALGSGIVVAFIFLGKDLSTTVIVFTVICIIFFLAGVGLRYVLPIVVSLSLLCWTGYNIGMHEDREQKEVDSAVKQIRGDYKPYIETLQKYKDEKILQLRIGQSGDSEEVIEQQVKDVKKMYNKNRDLLLKVRNKRIKTITEEISARQQKEMGIVRKVLNIGLSKERLKRLKIWQDPEYYKRDEGYQPYIAQLALGSGGMFGRGFTRSKMKEYFLPEAHTDFIVAIIGEEVGYVGVSLIIVLYMLLMLISFWISFIAVDTLGRLLASGIGFMLGLQAFTNISVVSGFFPPTGVTAPFISYGGSSMLVSLIEIGILLSIVAISDKVNLENGSYSLSK